MSAWRGPTLITVTLMNPVAYARYLSTTSMTKLSRELKVSKQYISRLEQGLYDRPNPTILKWASEILNKSSDKPVNQKMVEQLYREWQWQQRESVKMSKMLKPLSVTHFDRVSQRAANGGNENVIYYHTVFASWLESYWDSVHNFCVQMCLHPSPVADYVEGKTHSMPNKLRDVMAHLDLLDKEFKTNER